MKAAVGKPKLFIDLTEYEEKLYRKEDFLFLQERELEETRDILMPLVKIDLVPCNT